MFDHKGVSINVTDRGNFHATVGDLDISEPTLDAAKAQVEKALEKRKSEIKLAVVGILDSQGYGLDKDAKVMHCTLTGVNRTSRTFLYAEKLPANKHLTMVAADTPANTQALETYVVAERAYRQAQARVEMAQLKANGISGYGRIEIGDYDAVLAGLKTLYQASAALGAPKEVSQ